MTAKERLLNILDGMYAGQICGCPVCSETAMDTRTIATAEGVSLLASILEESYRLRLVLEDLPDGQDGDSCGDQTLGEFRDSIYAAGINQVAIDVQRHIAQNAAATDDCPDRCGLLDHEVLEYPLYQFLRTLHMAGIKEFVLDCARGREGQV